MIHIDRGTKKTCYNPYESYGEICVGCGCCSEDPRERAEARLNLHRRLLEDALSFDNWFEDDPELMALQRKNKDSDIEFHTRKMREYMEELERLK